MSDACSGLLANPGPAPPPPPPPPPGAGQVPALRISTASELAPRRGASGQQQQQEGYEPPAAIQNAMMTKDKKPFTYTPGMGGKLDLSQIRSPRMARRVAKNASDEGIEGPPKGPGSPPAQPSAYSPPRVAVPVLPQPGPAQLPLRSSSCLPRSPTPPTSPTSPTQVTLAKAPTPWMQRQASREPELPEWARRQAACAEPPPPPPPQQQQSSVPRRIEDRPSVFAAINEPGHHQFSNSNPHHASRWGNPVGQSAAAYVVPVQVEPQPQPQQTNHYNQNQMQYRSAADKRAYNQQAEPGPLQSQSFRVLQKITDTYNPDQLDGEQLRKLQLTEDDRHLMNKFKEQVDGEQYLHQEEDPRYRGAAIPSRAFRYLQTMTDSADLPHSTSRPVNSLPKKPNRHSNTFEEVPMQPYIPASQQQVQEPKKYTGGAIPSRSFRILQQMTTPESIGCPPWRCYSSASATDPADRSACDDEDRRAATPATCCNDDAARANAEKHDDSFAARCYSADNDTNHELDSQEDDDEEEEEEEEEEEQKEDQDAEHDVHTDNTSDSSSCDSESYWAYSTGLNPLNHRKDAADIEGETKESDEEDSDSTDCDKVSQFQEDSDTDKHEEEEEEEEDASTTVSVNLPLRFKSSAASDSDLVGSAAENRVETCVDFTLKRVVASGESGEEQAVAAVAEAVRQPDPEQASREDGGSTEETSDGEDSGVTSDVSRIISEADSDSERSLASRPKPMGPAPPAKSKRYERTQTHSRLLRLLVPSTPSATEPSTSSLPRPKSLDCEALLRATRYSALPQPHIYPRRNVCCPRTGSAKNIPRILAFDNQQPQSCLRSNIPTTFRLS